MAKKERIYSMTAIERGDHLVISKYLTRHQHHLLATENGVNGNKVCVIHYKSLGQNRGNVTKETINLSPKKSPVYRIRDRPTGTTVEEVLEKAEKYVDRGKFSPEDNNCESFVNWCIAEKNPTERILSAAEIQRGDHIMFRQFKGLHYHHCLAVEDGKRDNTVTIVHFNSCPKVFGEVVKETISIQPDIKLVFRLNNQTGTLKRNVDDVIAKAEHQVGLRKYTLEKKNCQSFVDWCHQETRYKERISKVTDIVKGDHLIYRKDKRFHIHHSLAVENGLHGNTVCVIHYTRGRVVEEHVMLDPEENDIFRIIERNCVDEGAVGDETVDDEDVIGGEGDDVRCGAIESDNDADVYAGVAPDEETGYVDDSDILFVLTNTDKIIEKARRQLGERKYSTDFNNCEHFVNWCKNYTGHKERILRLATVKRGAHLIIERFPRNCHLLAVEDGSWEDAIKCIHYSGGKVMEEKMSINPYKDNLFQFYDDCEEDLVDVDEVIIQARRQVGVKDYCSTEWKSSKHFVFWCKNRSSHKERLRSLVEVQKGDHIVIENYRGVKNHHSIAVDNSPGRGVSIIHYTANTVTEEEITVDTERHTVYRLHDDYYDEDVCRDPSKISLKAVSHLGRSMYSMDKNSNEHFVQWCKSETEILEEIKLVNEIKFGDHILVVKVNRGKVQIHHMLSIQDVSDRVAVIHFCDCDFLLHRHGDAKLHHKTVTAETMHLDFKKHDVYRVIHGGEHRIAIDRNIVMEMAHLLLNAETPSTKFGNCQQFVRRCQGAMFSNVRVLKNTDIKRGCHYFIERRRDLCYHHFLAVEDCEEDNDVGVIHYKSNTTSGSLGKVVEEKLQLKWRKERMFRVLYNREVDPESVINKAKSTIGQCEYSSTKNTNEHFVTWCKTGTSNHGDMGNAEETKEATAEHVQEARPFLLAFQDGMTLVAHTFGSAVERFSLKGLSHIFIRGFAHASLVSLAVTGAVAAASAVATESLYLAVNIVRIKGKTNQAVLSIDEWRQINTEQWQMAGKFIGGVAGSVGGAILGQLLIPVPILGAVVGGVVLGFAGRMALGFLAGALGQLTYRADIYRYPRRRHRKVKWKDEEGTAAGVARSSHQMNAEGAGH